MKDKKHISLEEIGTELPFTVPENYFEKFATQFDEQIKMKSVSFVHSLKPWMYMAAMFVGIFVLSQVFFLLDNYKVDSNTDNYESYVLSQVDEAYMLDYYVEDATQQDK